MYCKHCGKQIADNSKFCSHCGKPLDENATDYMKSIHHFVASNMKKIGIILILLLCLVWDGFGMLILIVIRLLVNGKEKFV